MAFPLKVTAFLSNSIVLTFFIVLWNSLLSKAENCLLCSMRSEHSLCLAPLGHCRCYRHMVAGHSGGDCTSPAPPRSSSDRPRPVSLFPLLPPCAYSFHPHLLHRVASATPQLHCTYVPWRSQGGRAN